LVWRPNKKAVFKSTWLQSLDKKGCFSIIKKDNSILATARPRGRRS